MLLIAMDKANPLTPENVAAEMHKVCGYKGLQGTFCYDETGEGIKTTFLGVIKDGKLTVTIPEEPAATPAATAAATAAK
jgi:hypothetical protein